MKHYINNKMTNLILYPSWITGFADGESTFGINISKSTTHKSGYRVKVWFAIAQDERDLNLLAEACEACDARSARSYERLF